MKFYPMHILYGFFVVFSSAFDILFDFLAIEGRLWCIYEKTGRILTKPLILSAHRVTIIKDKFVL